MDDAEILKLFEPLFAALQGEDSFPKKRPLPGALYVGRGAGSYFAQ